MKKKNSSLTLYKQVDNIISAHQLANDMHAPQNVLELRGDDSFDSSSHLSNPPSSGFVDLL